MLEPPSKSNGISEPTGKLDLDFVGSRLLHAAMATGPDNDERWALVGWLFYLITANCEGAAEQAARGKGESGQGAHVVDLANRLRATG